MRTPTCAHNCPSALRSCPGSDQRTYRRLVVHSDVGLRCPRDHAAFRGEVDEYLRVARPCDIVLEAEREGDICRLV